MNYFTSDWHLNETRIFDFNPFFRPFKSIKEQNETIINNINDIVKKEDTLYHIGDVAINKEGIDLLSNIYCKHKFLIVGNYDAPYLDELSEYFTMLGLDRDILLSNNEMVTLCHYPNIITKEEFGIVGHVHGLWKVQKNMINVGVDEQIRRFPTALHHYRERKALGYFFEIPDAGTARSGEGGRPDQNPR